MSYPLLIKFIITFQSTPIDKIVKTNKLNGVITEAQNVDVKMNIPSGTIKREFCSKFPADVSVENEVCVQVANLLNYKNC